MKRKKIFPMMFNELEELSTKQLLARLKRLHQCEESIALSDRDADDNETEGLIEFKDSPQWIAEYENVKNILAQREHIPKEVELTEVRRRRAQKAKTSERKTDKQRNYKFK